MSSDHPVVQRRRFLVAASWLSVAAMLASAPLTVLAQGTPERKPPAKKRTPAHPLGLSLEEVPTSQPEGRGSAPGLLVTRAVGTAAEAGLQAGDVVIELNGKPVTTVTDFWDRAAAAEWRLQLRASRNGKALSFTLSDPVGNQRPR